MDLVERLEKETYRYHLNRSKFARTRQVMAEAAERIAELETEIAWLRQAKLATSQTGEAP